MSAAPTDRMDTTCACGARFRVPTSAVGKKAKCPKCGVVFTIQAGEMAQAPAPSANIKLPPKPKPAAPASVEASSGSDADSLLDDLAQMERQAPAVGGSTPAALCVKCGQALAPGAKACMNCGYNSATGKTVRAASARQVKVAKAMSEGGRFALGVVLSGIAAIVSAVIWFVIAAATDTEFGLIAWGVGLLCGFAMLKGWGRASGVGGVIAAGMAAFGIVLAKILIFAFVLYAIVSGDTENPLIQRASVAVNMANTKLDEEGVFEDSERRERYQELFPEMLARVTMMSDEKIAERIEEIRAEFAAQSDYSLEAGMKRARLARHAADRRAEQHYLAEDDPRRLDFYREEYRTLRGTPEVDLDAAIFKMEDWLRAGRWEDEEHIRTLCIHRIVRADMEQREAELRAGALSNVELERAAWKGAVAHGEEVCNQQTHEERVADLRGIEWQKQREHYVERLAYHRGERRGDAERLSPGDQTRDEYYEEERSNLANVSDDNLLRDIAALDDWEANSRWEDEDYVHSVLAYHFADMEESERLQARWVDDNYENDVVTEDEWRQIYDEGARRADAVASNDRVALAKQIDSGEIWVGGKHAAGNEDAPGVAMLAVAFFARMFGLIDLILVGVAVYFAYRVGARGIGDDN